MGKVDSMTTDMMVFLCVYGQHLEEQPVQA